MNQLDSIIKIDVAKRETPAPRIICEDGESVSIQASKFTYCSPRDDFAPWYAVEAGFPSCTPPDSWQEFAEEWTPSKPSMGWLLKLIRYEIEKAVEYRSFGMFRRSVIRNWIRHTGKPGTQTVFGWLPIELAAEFIEAHGGESNPIGGNDE